MSQLIAVSLVVTSGLFIVYVLNSIRENLRHAARAKALGCQPPIWRSSYDPTGIKDLVGGLKASNQQRFPSFNVKFFEQESRKYGRPVGTIRLVQPFFRQIFFTSDPQNIQAMLALKFKDFGLGITRTANFAPLLGDGIFASNGKQWEHSRALLRPQFNRSQISDLRLEEGHIRALMTVLDSQVGSDGWTSLVDLQVLLFRLTLDSATEILFGENVNSQQGGSKLSKQGNASFAYAFDRAQYIMSIATRLGPSYWMAHTPEFHRMVKRVHDFVDYFVQLALAQDSDDKEPDKEERYVFLRALAKETRDPTELRSQLLNILLAGRDTTASTLGWLFFIVASPRHAPVFRRLRATIREEFGTYSQPRDMTFERMKDCRYLHWCINECLRLYPIVPLNVRTAQVDTTLPMGGGLDGRSPFYVKKGQHVAYSVHTMHRRKDLWGADAEDFKPERWEKRRPGWDYLPFNGGPRICIGQQFALTKVAYVTIRMIQRIDAIDGSQLGPVKHGLSLTNCPGDGVKVKLHFSE